jgi:hypothetical protein
MAPTSKKGGIFPLFSKIPHSRVKKFTHEKGYLFLVNEDLVRILDVASGTFLRDIRSVPNKLDSIICCASTNYVVILACNNNSKLSVYDLKCLKEIDAVPSHLLLTSFDLDWIVKKMAMDEHRIVCLSDKKMFVVDLKLIDRLRCPESC